jgi:FkbM family methyltransferase
MALIYDVGMNNGDDTAYYLSRGHRVVAVEAVPEFVEAGRARFFQQIASGQVIILNVAIAEECGYSDFWVCDEVKEWSSLYKQLAGRDDKKHHKIIVRASTFREILTKHGCPHYLKIDIEASDRLCLSALQESALPQFISVESECGGNKSLTAREYLAIIEKMQGCGYNRFKLVNQHTLVPVNRSTLKDVFDSSYRDATRAGIEQRCKWRFPEGSSGPFGNDIPGPWMECSEATDVYLQCREMFFRMYDVPPYWFWFDWHGTRI